MADHLADKDAVVADARDRAWRTFVQNAVLDVAVAVGTGLQQALATGDPFTLAFWVALGMSLGKTVLLIAASYLMRLKKAPASEQ